MHGKNAIDDYEKRYNQVNDISTLLSLKLDDILNGVKTLDSDYKKAKSEISNLKLEILKMKMNSLVISNVMTYTDNTIDSSKLKDACELLLEKSNHIACIISNSKYLLMSKEYNFNNDIKMLKENNIIRGGGKDTFSQGQILDQSLFENYLKTLS